MATLDKISLERLVENENIDVNENELKNSGIYNVESKNFNLTLQYPTKFGFYTNTTMALSVNKEIGIIVTYNFKEEEDLKYFLDMIDPQDFSENYFYSNVKDGIQVLPQKDIRLFLSKEDITELYVVLTKVYLKLKELNIISNYEKEKL